MVNGARNGRAKGALMNSLSWRLAKLISLMLEKDEREAVLWRSAGVRRERTPCIGRDAGPGDAATSRVAYRPALVDCSYLVRYSVRPASRLIARIFASSGAVLSLALLQQLELEIFGKSWRARTAGGESGYGTDPIPDAGLLGVHDRLCAPADGAQSNQMHAFFFCVLLLLEKFARLPALIGLKLYPAVSFRATAAVFAVPFYRVMLPVIIQMVMVAAPAIWGMHHATRVSTLGPRLRMLLRLAAGATVCVMGLQICWVGGSISAHGCGRVSVAVSNTGDWLCTGPFCIGSHAFLSREDRSIDRKLATQEKLTKED